MSHGPATPTLFRSDLWLGRMLLPALVVCLLVLIALGFDAQNGVRTHVGGESRWSKGQKAAVRALHVYAATGDDAAYAEFRRALDVPIAYRDGRREMLRPDGDMAYVARRMADAGTHPDDAPSAIRLVRWFRRAPHLAAALAVWEEGDREIGVLERQAEALRALVRRGAPEAERRRALWAIDATDRRLTRLESRFSEVLSEGARWLGRTVLALVAATALLLAWIGSALTARLIRQARLAAESDATRARDARALLEHADDLIARFDAAGRMVYANPAIARVAGIPPEQSARRTGDGVAEAAPEFGARCRDAVGRVFATGRAEAIEFDLATPRGVRHFHCTIAPERDGDADERVETALAIARDVTELRRSEQAVREREAQMRQMQKVEAVGRLAGGIAHDFNNLLTVIRMSGELLAEQIPPGDPKREDVDDIRAAADRAASLTRQLLAYSRRQVLVPEVLDLNAVVSGLGPMLRRLIGEDVRVGEALDPALGAVRADRGQLEQVLVNLAVNARDAMPGGGRVTIETANEVVFEGASLSPEFTLPPGEYVRLTVRDTGHGMDEATRGRIFEPFFTTKAPGEGTGLGLATVYGIVKQSGGWVWCETAPRAGARFHVLLPRVAAPAERPRPAAPAPAAGGVETVLLAEDEDAVRALARRVLERQGYRVLAARDGEDALRAADAHDGAIDLLVTDLVMPHLGGRALALRMRERVPALPVLFMSGYTDDDIVRRGALEPGTTFMQKPFTAQRLLRAVRETLDARAAAER